MGIAPPSSCFIGSASQRRFPGWSSAASTGSHRVSHGGARSSERADCCTPCMFYPPKGFASQWNAANMQLERCLPQSRQPRRGASGRMPLRGVPYGRDRRHTHGTNMCSRVQYPESKSGHQLASAFLCQLRQAVCRAF